MLRLTVLGLAILMICVSLIGLAHGWPRFVVIEIGVFGLLILIGTLFERRYRPKDPKETTTKGLEDTPKPMGPDQNWVETGERFIDPETGKLVIVTWNPKTGERRYAAQNPGV